VLLQQEHRGESGEGERAHGCPERGGWQHYALLCSQICACEAARPNCHILILPLVTLGNAPTTSMSAPARPLHSEHQIFVNTGDFLTDFSFLKDRGD